MNKRVCKNCESGAKFCETWRKYSGEYTCMNPKSHNFKTVMRANVGCNKFSKGTWTAPEAGTYNIEAGAVQKPDK